MSTHDFNLALHPLLLGPLGATFPRWQQGRSHSAVFIIADEHTWAHCAPVFFAQTGLSPEATAHVVIPAGEKHKYLVTCEQIWSAMFAAGLDRKALVINLGGGVTGDMGGFCAATYKRGVDFLQIPTTLLAATDASVGGKLGIDFQGIKNAVGVFANPAGVLIDPVFFKTLSQRELHSGFAEVIKHAAIGTPELWAMIGGLTDLRTADWFSILRASITVKTTVVQQDPFEKGLRAVLNYGHTIGHAIESYFLDTDAPLTHGEAIACGMILETTIREKNGRVYTGDKAFLQKDRLSEYFHRFFPPVALPPDSIDELWALMQQDKKNDSGSVRMALPGDGAFTMEWMGLEREGMVGNEH